MSRSSIQVEDLGKRYQLGTIGYGSLQHDLRAWWARRRGREDPNSTIGEKSRLDLHGDFWALKSVGFSLEQGSRVGVIGRNGAGKSTLLKLLSRVTGPTTGSIRVKGRIASLLEVGTGFHPELTGRENVFLNGAILGMKRKEIEAKFDEIVSFSGVEQFIDTPVKRYSSGMYVRLAFSVAAHLESEIMIIDEVLAVGDAEFQKKCLAKMENLSRAEGRTLLFVSHNSSAISSLCQTVLFLEKGRLIRQGPTTEVLTEYLRNDNLGGLIRNHSAKEGSKELEIVEIQLESRGRKVSEVYCGETLVIRLHYEKSKVLEGTSRVSVMIQNNSGGPVCLLDNRMANQILDIRAEEGDIVVTIPCLNLTPGLYSVGYSIMINDRGHERFADRLQTALDFAVLPSDYTPSGLFPTDAFGPVVLLASWALGSEP